MSSACLFVLHARGLSLVFFLVFCRQTIVHDVARPVPDRDAFLFDDLLQVEHVDDAVQTKLANSRRGARQGISILIAELERQLVEPVREIYETLGPTRKAARVKYLSGLVRDALEGIPGVDFISEPDEARRTGLARVSVAGRSGRELTTVLREDHAIYTYGNFPGPYDGVYISPNVFNDRGDMLAFVSAIDAIARRSG